MGKLFKFSTLKEAKEDLVSILTDPDMSSIIELKNVHPLISTVAMNYGSIWDEHRTYIKDKENKTWYVINNAESDKKIIKSNHGTFRQANKVSPSSIFAYDGTVDDILAELVEKGYIIKG